MSAIDQYIERIPNAELQEQLRIEIARLTKKKSFWLEYENTCLIMSLCQKSP